MRVYQSKETTNKKTGKELNLSFDFEIQKFGWREIYVHIKKPIRDLEFNERYYVFFFEDLFYYVYQSGHQAKWDFGKWVLSGFENLNLTPEQLDTFKKWWLGITNFDAEIEE